MDRIVMQGEFAKLMVVREQAGRYSYYTELDDVDGRKYWTWVADNSTGELPVHVSTLLLNLGNALFFNKPDKAGLKDE